MKWPLAVPAAGKICICEGGLPRNPVIPGLLKFPSRGSHRIPAARASAAGERKSQFVLPPFPAGANNLLVSGAVEATGRVQLSCAC